MRKPKTTGIFKRSRYSFIEIDDANKTPPDFVWLFLTKVREGEFEIDQFDQIWKLFHGARIRAEREGQHGPVVHFGHEGFAYAVAAKNIIWSWNGGEPRVIPPGLLVATLDGNPLNTTLDNLVLATKGEATWLGMTRKRAIQLQLEITLEDLFRKIRRRRHK